MSNTIIPTAVLQEVMDAMDDMATDSRLLDMKQSRVHGFDAARDALRAALEQPQNHVPDVGNMVQAGWKLVPVELMHEMLRAGRDAHYEAEKRIQDQDAWSPGGFAKRVVRAAHVFQAMLNAAPQPPTTEQSSAVEQQQGEQEPVALLADAIRSEPTELIHKWRVLELIQDHARQQPKRELMDNEARRIYSEATYHASLAVFMTRMDAENPDADDKGVSGWLQEAEDRVKSRITEAAHEIGQAAAPQPPALGRPQSDPAPYLWYDPDNGDTWTQEAVDEGFCATDSLIPLYTK